MVSASSPLANGGPRSPTSASSVTNGNGFGTGTGSTTASNGHANNGEASSSSSSSTTAAATASALLDDPEPTFQPLYEGSNIDRREFVRLALQSLKDLGFASAAKSLETESGIILEHPSIAAFRSAVLAGDWKNSERLLMDGLNYAAARMARRNAAAASSHGAASNGGGPSRSATDVNLALRDPETHSINSIKFLLHQQRYLELLEAKNPKKALSVLRERLQPLNQGAEKLHMLSSLVICVSVEELRARAKWPGTGRASRQKLLLDIERAVDPSVMVPSRRLPELLEQAQSLQKSWDPFYNFPEGTRHSLYTDLTAGKMGFPSHTAAVLKGHDDEVWHLAWSHDGTRLATAGKDEAVCIWRFDPIDEHRSSGMADWELVEKYGMLHAPVSHVAWSPDDSMLAAAADKEVTIWNLQSHSRTTWAAADFYPVVNVAWLPDGNRLVTGGQDCKLTIWSSEGQCLRSIDSSPWRVLGVSASPDGKHLVTVSFRPLSTSLPADAPPVSASASRSMRYPAQPGHEASLSTGTGTSTGSSWPYDSSSPSPISIIGFGNSGSELAAVAEASSAEETRPARGEDLAGGSRTLTEQKYKLGFVDVETQAEVGAVYAREEMMTVSISADSRYALVNVRPSEVQLWDIASQSCVTRYKEVQHQNHIVGSCFGGAQANFVASGSEDSKIYVYQRSSGKLLQRLSGHETGTVNNVAWHPLDHSMLASCGDDGTIRIWTPPPLPGSDVAGHARWSLPERSAGGGSGGAGAGAGAGAGTGVATSGSNTRTERGEREASEAQAGGTGTANEAQSSGAEEDHDEDEDEEEEDEDEEEEEEEEEEEDDGMDEA